MTFLLLSLFVWYFSKHPHSGCLVQTGVPHQEISLLLPLSSDRLRHPFPAFHHLRRFPAGDSCFPPRRPYGPAARGQCCRVCCQPRLHLVYRTLNCGPVRGVVPPPAPPSDQLPGTGKEDHCGGAGVVARLGCAFLLVVGCVEGQPPSHLSGCRPHMDACDHHILSPLQYFPGAELFNNPYAEDKAEAAALPGGAWASTPSRKNNGHATGPHCYFLSSVGSSNCCSHLPPLCVLSSPGLACPPGLWSIQYAGNAQHSCQLFPVLLRQQAFPQRCAGHHAAQRRVAAPLPGSTPTAGPKQRFHLLFVQWEQQALTAGLNPFVTSQEQKALLIRCFPFINSKHPSSHRPGPLQTQGSSAAFQGRLRTAASWTLMVFIFPDLVLFVPVNQTRRLLIYIFPTRNLTK